MEKDIKETKDGKRIKTMMLVVAGFYFFYHAIYFLNLEGSWLPIPSTLYNLIIYLSICFLLIYKKELI